MTSPSIAGHAHALRACWHPVLASAGLERGTPIAADLLGEALVLWRDRSGATHAFHDLCIHRGTALSLGTVEGDEIVCPYHGWRYRADGACTRIPQLADPTRVPAKARATAFHCTERYGLVWVALEEPRFPLPEVPELDDEGWATVSCGPYTWACDASRQIENFTDFGHFPWVHPGLLGDPERPVVPEHSVTIDGHVLRYEIVRPEAPANEAFPVFGNEVVVAPERRSRYELHLPYSIVLRLGWGGQAGMVYFFVCRPEGPERTTGFLAIARNYNLEQSAAVLQEFEDVIFEQDRRIVESQRPERVPFDLADELHLTFDAVAVAYRRAMRACGLAL
jgi:phenylpropionate dioxygenase-like ring-hydroxylating dioxygenase large terminal subunit